jgi:hypothetical protein
VSLVQRFDPPGFLSDFQGIAGQAEAWHRAVYGWFEDSIASEGPALVSPAGAPPNRVQFYNPARFDPGGPVIEQAIIWNAFPKELLRKYGRERAMREADRLVPLSYYSPKLNQEIHQRTFYRPLNEYCEWHVVRDPDTQAIVRVTFSSEPPEFWQALFGDTFEISDSLTVSFPGDRDKVLALYQELVSPEVRKEDLIAQEDIPGTPGNPPLVRKGQYNLYNRWNTQHGIMHLCSPPNSLQAEIQLGADATILRANTGGKPVVQPEHLVCCSQYGGPDRNSDPTIGSSVNALARLGALITLPNPVGLYMDHIDLTGWEIPNGKDPAGYVRIVRGRPGMIERLEIRVPKDCDFTVSDITIGGEPIRYGGQIAECITVKLVGAAAAIGSIHNTPAGCTGKCCVDPTNTALLHRSFNLDDPTPPGEIIAFAEPARLERVGGAPQRIHRVRANQLRRVR